MRLTALGTNLALAADANDSADVKGVTCTSCHAPQDVVQVVKLFLASNKLLRSGDLIEIVGEHIELNRGLALVTQKQTVGWPRRGRV